MSKTPSEHLKNSDDADELTMQGLLERGTRCIYSQANLKQLTWCENFVKVVLHAFSSGKSVAKVTQYAVCLEDHTKDVGKYFYMVVKLRVSRP